jgi:hypothetical protein
MQSMSDEHLSLGRRQNPMIQTSPLKQSLSDEHGVGGVHFLLRQLNPFLQSESLLFFKKGYLHACFCKLVCSVTASISTLS